MGISIRSESLAGNPLSGRDYVRTTTGADGRYRLVGMPTGAGNWLESVLTNIIGCIPLRRI